MLAKIHSIETFGTVDGPGVRLVVFMQGCPMRCLYCHNPDTWDKDSGELKSSDDILNTYDDYSSFLSGGITLSGGEPLLQIEFVTELFEKAKKKGIHTCIDTSGITFNKDKIKDFDRLLSVTDLVMLDIKHIDDEKHKKLTGHSNKNILEFAKYVAKSNTELWIRHVVVPGITDDLKSWQELGKFIKQLQKVKAIDILPYHTMGTEKYKKMGIEYPLENLKALDKKVAAKAKEEILKAIYEN